MSQSLLSCAQPPSFYFSSRLYTAMPSPHPVTVLRIPTHRRVKSSRFMVCTPCCKSLYKEQVQIPCQSLPRPKHLFLIFLPLIVSLSLTVSALLWIGVET